MDITVNTLTRCAGQDHYHFVLTVGGQAVSFTVDRKEFALDPDERQDAVVGRIRSDLKENGITTFAAAKTRLEGRSFKI